MMGSAANARVSVATPRRRSADRMTSTDADVTGTSSLPDPFVKTRPRAVERRSARVATAYMGTARPRWSKSGRGPFGRATVKPAAEVMAGRPVMWLGPASRVAALRRESLAGSEAPGHG
jgi:hypothetical protein